LPPSPNHQARLMQKKLFLQTQIPPLTNFTFVPSGWPNLLTSRSKPPAEGAC
jgi:hypothetical protein